MYQIYFIECVENISNFLSVACVKLLIFSTHEIKYFWYLPNESKLSFYFFR